MATRYEVDLATTRPGTPGGIFLRQFWHAIGRSEDLAPGRAVPLRIIAVQAGQGRIADREHEFLGRSDAGIVLWRRLLQRELRAIAEGRPPKKWSRPPQDVVPVVGIPQ